MDSIFGVAERLRRTSPACDASSIGSDASQALATPSLGCKPEMGKEGEGGWEEGDLEISAAGRVVCRQQHVTMDGVCRIDDSELMRDH